MMRTVFILAAALLLGAWSPSKLAYGQVRAAMKDAGLSDANARCMAGRMTDRLSLVQLIRLRRLRGTGRSLADYVAAVRRQGDREAMTVTASSALLCASGWAREKK